MRMINPVNGPLHRPSFFENHVNPYVCGRCGHECSSVADQAVHMHAEHAQFMAEVAEHTGIQGGPEAIYDGFKNHKEVIDADPVTLLHKLQRDRAAQHIAIGFKQSADLAIPEYQQFLYSSLAFLERCTLEYPTAPEVYEHIARSAQFLGKERLAADYWALAVEIDVAFDRRVLKDNRAPSLTMTRLGDTDQAEQVFKHPYKRSIFGLLKGSIFSDVQGSRIERLDSWPTRRLINPMINRLRADPNSMVEQGFRSVLAEFREIKNYNDQIFQALMSGELEEEDLDLNLRSQVHERLFVLKQCLKACPYFFGAEQEYWLAHLELYTAYRHARRRELEAGLAAAENSIRMFKDFEARSDYPGCIPTDLIEEYVEGEASNSVQAYLISAGLHSEGGDEAAVATAYDDAVQHARDSALAATVKVLALQKAGEFHLFKNQQRAIPLFSDAIDILTTTGAVLMDENEQVDMTLLKLKDCLATALELSGKSKDAELIQSEIEPFEELITWRETLA